MTAGFELVAKSLMVASMALIVLHLLRHRSAAERSWLAHLGLAAALVVPLAGELGPRWHVSSATVTDIAPAALAVDEVVSVLPASPPAADALTSGEGLALLGYSLPALLLLAVTGIAVLRLFALRRRSVVLVDAPWLAALAHAQRRMGFKHGAALLVSPELASPVSWGLFRPTILVGDASATSPDDAEAIIAHELAHVARFDWIKLILARAATALLWFNPFVWVLARHCHQLREEAADDAVLRSAVSGPDYAQLLVSAARHENRGLLLAANGVAPSRASLGARVRRALDGSTARTPVRLGWSAACVAVGMAIGAPLAALTLAPVPSESAAAQLATPRPTIAVAATEPEIVPLPKSVAEQPQTGEPTIPHARTIGVSARSARELADRSRPGPAAYSTRELMMLDVQGADLVWIASMRALGYRDLPFKTAMGMAVQDVSPDYVRELAAAGYPRVSASQLIAMRIHGVDGRFIRRTIARTGRRPSPGDLLTMKITGFGTAVPRPVRAHSPPRPEPPPPDDEIDDDLDLSPHH